MNTAADGRIGYRRVIFHIIFHTRKKKEKMWLFFPFTFLFSLTCTHALPFLDRRICKRRKKRRQKMYFLFQKKKKSSVPYP